MNIKVMAYCEGQERSIYVPEMFPNHCKSVPRKKSSRGTLMAESARLRRPELCPLGVLRDCSVIGTGLGEADTSDEAARATRLSVKMDNILEPEA